MAFLLQLEATLRRPHLDGSLSRPIARWTWVGAEAGKESIHPEQRLAHPVSTERRGCAGARGAETLPGLGKWAEDGQGGPSGLVQGSVVGKKGLRPADPAWPLQARRPGWRRVERSRGARSALPAGRARPSGRGQIRWPHI